MNQHIYLGAPTRGVRSYLTYPESRIPKHHNWKPVFLGFRGSIAMFMKGLGHAAMLSCCHAWQLKHWLPCRWYWKRRHKKELGKTFERTGWDSMGVPSCFLRAVHPKCAWRSSKQSFKKLKVPGFKKWHPFGERSLKRPNWGYDTQGIWRSLMGKSRLLGRQFLFCQVILLIRWSAKHVPSTWKCNTSVKLREIWKKFLDGKVWCSNQPLGGLGNNACSIGMQMSRPAWQLVKRPRLRLG